MVLQGDNLILSPKCFVLGNVRIQKIMISFQINLIESFIETHTKTSRFIFFEFEVTINKSFH